MHIYLVRHAEAYPAGEQGIVTDRDRFLTPRGRRQAQRVGRALGRLGAVPAEVWTSPLVRARETAELLAAALPGSPPVVDLPALAEGDEGRVLARLKAAAPADILLTGHAPFMGELLARFATPDGRGSIPMAKASAACLELEVVVSGGAELRWLLSRRVIRHLAMQRAAV